MGEEINKYLDNLLLNQQNNYPQQSIAYSNSFIPSNIYNNKTSTLLRPTNFYNDISNLHQTNAFNKNNNDFKMYFLVLSF